MAKHWMYEVSTEFSDGRIATAWAEWMLSEHIADVIAAGAICGRLLLSGDIENNYVAQYEFDSEAAMREYLEEQSPRLRAEAAKRFDPTSIKFTRRTLEIIR